jgi:glycosyltransferase involved in cell wall biosynthesis
VALTVNPILAEVMAQAYAVPRLAVVENAVDPPPSFDPTAQPDLFRKNLPIAGDQKILLYQGWLAKYRGLVPLVQAMPLVAPSIHLVFMGYGTERDDLRALARALGVADRVHFPEAVSHEELLYWSASADVGIIPYQPVDLNTYYSSPNKIYEYIQAGLVILSNDLPYCRRVVEGGDFGLVRKLDTTQAFANAINTIFADPARLARYKTNILAQRPRYSWQHESRTILSIYEHLPRSQKKRGFHAAANRDRNKAG